MSYLIKKDQKTNTITFLQYDLKGYKFTPKSKDNAKISVSQIVVVNPSMIDKILTIKFNAMFKKLVAYVANFLNDEDTDSSDAMFALTEIDRLKSIIMNKYHSYIALEKQKFFLNQLSILEQQLNMKMLMQYQFNQTPFLEEEQIQGRGR